MRPFRFSTRTILLVMTVLLGGLACLQAFYLGPLRREALLRDRLIVAGFYVASDVPRVLRWLPGDNYCRVTAVSVFFHPGTPEDLSREFSLLQHLKHLQHVSIKMSHAPRTLFASLPSDGELQELNISSISDDDPPGALGLIKPTPDSISELKKIRSLRHLTFFDCGLDDACLVALGDLTHLETLDLRMNSISDLGIKHLSSLKRLKELQLDFTEVTGDGIIQLPQYKTIVTLSVDGTPASQLSALWYTSQGFAPPRGVR